MSNIHEAAERLRIYNANPKSGIDATWVQDGYVFGRCKVMDDILTMANFGLSLTNPAPITAEALLERGFAPERQPEGGSFTDYFLDYDGDLIEFRIYKDNELKPDCWIDHRGLHNAPTTLGQLTALLLALTTHTTPRGEA